MNGESNSEFGMHCITHRPIDIIGASAGQTALLEVFSDGGTPSRVILDLSEVELVV